MIPFVLTDRILALYSVPFNRPLLYDRGDSRRSLSRTRPSRNDMGRHLPLVEPVEAPLTTSETAQLAFMFCPLWFCANWAMNAALGYTSVSSTTILSSMSGFFTLAAGACVGVEIFTVGKLLSVILRWVTFFPEVDLRGPVACDENVRY